MRLRASDAVNATMRIEELKQLCRAHLRGWVAASGCFLAEVFPERQIFVRELDRMSIYRLSRGAQVGLAAFAIMTSGWAIAVVIGLVFGGPAPRVREAGNVVAVKLELAPKPAAASLEAAAPPDPEDEVAAVADPAGEAAAEDEMGQVLTGPEVAGYGIFAPVDEPAAEAAGASLALSFPGEADHPCGSNHEPERPQAARGDAVDRLRNQLAAISERVFALATRGLGAPAPAEDAIPSARVTEEAGEAALAQMASLERHVDRLASGVTALRSAETELVLSIQPQLAYFIATAERVIERAGTDLDDVFQERTKPKRTAEGGPFIAAISGPLAAER
ncbi:MAG: hypothetical protein ACXW25_09925, partial [Rhodospirillales bacterium]